MENWTRVSRLRPWHVAVFCAAIFMAGMMAPTLTTAQSSSKEEVYRQLGLLDLQRGRLEELHRQLVPGHSASASQQCALRRSCAQILKELHGAIVHIGPSNTSFSNFLVCAWYHFSWDQITIGNQESFRIRDVGAAAS